MRFIDRLKYAFFAQLLSLRMRILLFVLILIGVSCVNNLLVCGTVDCQKLQTYHYVLVVTIAFLLTIWFFKRIRRWVRG